MKMIFVTSYLKKDGLYASQIEATSWEEAEKTALENGLGEKVDGVLDTSMNQCNRNVWHLQDRQNEMNNLLLMPLQFFHWMLRKSISIHHYCLDKLTTCLLS